MPARDPSKPSRKQLETWLFQLATNPNAGQPEGLPDWVKQQTQSKREKALAKLTPAEREALGVK